MSAHHLAEVIVAVAADATRAASLGEHSLGRYSAAQVGAKLEAQPHLEASSVQSERLRWCICSALPLRRLVGSQFGLVAARRFLVMVGAPMLQGPLGIAAALRKWWR